MTRWALADREYIVVATLVVALCACERNEPRVFTGQTMGTTYMVKVVGTGKSTRELEQGVAAALFEVNELMSTYREDSEVSRFNSYGQTEWFPLSRQLYEVVTGALEVSETTDGAFDVTVGPLVNAWGFGTTQDAQRPPSAAIVESERARVGFRKLALRSDPPALRKQRVDVYLDLSAIAKGYGVDAVASYLNRQGVEHYMIEVGGELRAIGRNAAGRAWRIGVETPTSSTRVVQRIVPLVDMAMATSGGYRNFFEHAGARYSHTLDPLTGAPVTHNLASVTVLHRSAMTADAVGDRLIGAWPKTWVHGCGRTGDPCIVYSGR